MGKLRRTAMIVFVVAAVLGVGVLAALWFAWEPLFPFIAWLVSMDWFFVVEAILPIPTDDAAGATSSTRGCGDSAGPERRPASESPDTDPRSDRGKP